MKNYLDEIMQQADRWAADGYPDDGREYRIRKQLELLEDFIVDNISDSCYTKNTN